MRGTSEPAEVYALRYSARPECTTSEVFYRHDLYEEPERAVGMDYFFWLVRDRGRTLLVDCGFSERTAAIRGRSVHTEPSELLSRMGVAPAAVDHVVLSHMHFDHVGNADAFPNATFHLARAEFEHWTGPYREHPAFSWPVEAAEVRLLESLWREERLELLDDDAEITPGVRATRFPGHTPGQLVTSVATGDRCVVLASDAAHYYDEIDRQRPFYLFSDLGSMLDSYRGLRELDSRPDTDVIPGHDPAVAAEYAEVERNCFDLTRPGECSTRQR